MLQLRGVAKSYDGRVVLHPTDLVPEPGRVTVLIGPSGCGKSTLLRLALGLLRPDAGEVRFDGRLLSPETARDARRRMGYVVQDGGLFPHLTAGENTALVARTLGWPDERAAARLRELAGLVRLPADALDRY